MNFFNLFFLLIFSFSLLQAQDEPPVKSKWTDLGVAGLNISQIALSNWTQGGDNALTWTIFGNFGLNYTEAPWKLTNKLKLAYGRTKLGDADFRTNDNEIYLETVLSFNMGWAVSPYFSNTVRTVISDGFDYKKTDPSDPTKPLQTSALFDPGYITQSIGFTYDKTKGFKTRLGLAFEETFTNKFRQYSDPVNKMDNFRFDTGIESVTEGEFALEENMLLNSKLRLFSAFDKLDVWDVRWDNTITAKISKYFNVNLNVLLIHDIDQSLKTQFKEALQLGITYTLF